VPSRFAWSSASRSAGAWPSSPASVARLMRTRSWYTTRPAPMLVWPTSELPICPSGSPTASPAVCSSAKGMSRASLSSAGVPASAMALLSRSRRSPQPSSTTSSTL